MSGLEGLIMLFRFLRRDAVEGGIIEKPFGWIQWGYLSAYGASAPWAWYILIRLPSYEMKESLYDECPRWHQRCLLFKEPLPAGDGGWREIEMVCES